jgi:hypothetical protein
MADNTLELKALGNWVVSNPWPRAGIPAVVGAVLGFLTNILSSAVYQNDKIEWAKLFQQGTFWFAILFLLIGIFYQIAIYNQDNRTQSVLEKSKEGLAENLAAYYSKKIEAGDINDLVESDKKLREIFKSRP